VRCKSHPRRARGSMHSARALFRGGRNSPVRQDRPIEKGMAKPWRTRACDGKARSDGCAPRACSIDGSLARGLSRTIYCSPLCSTRRIQDRVKRHGLRAGSVQGVVVQYMVAPFFPRRRRIDFLPNRSWPVISPIAGACVMEYSISASASAVLFWMHPVHRTQAFIDCRTFSHEAQTTAQTNYRLQ